MDVIRKVVDNIYESSSELVDDIFAKNENFNNLNENEKKNIKNFCSAFITSIVWVSFCSRVNGWGVHNANK